MLVNVDLKKPKEAAGAIVSAFASMYANVETSNLKPEDEDPFEDFYRATGKKECLFRRIQREVDKLKPEIIRAVRMAYGPKKRPKWKFSNLISIRASGVSGCHAPPFTGKGTFVACVRLDRVGKPGKKTWGGWENEFDAFTLVDPSLPLTNVRFISSKGVSSVYVFIDGQILKCRKWTVVRSLRVLPRVQFNYIGGSHAIQEEGPCKGNAEAFKGRKIPPAHHAFVSSVRSLIKPGIEIPPTLGENSWFPIEDWERESLSGGEMTSELYSILRKIRLFEMAESVLYPLILGDLRRSVCPMVHNSIDMGEINLSSSKKYEGLPTNLIVGEHGAPAIQVKLPDGRVITGIVPLCDAQSFETLLEAVNSRPDDTDDNRRGPRMWGTRGMIREDEMPERTPNAFFRRPTV